jgi:hypothetical protein
MRVIPRVPLERSNSGTAGKPRLSQGKNDHDVGFIRYWLPISEA